MCKDLPKYSELSAAGTAPLNYQCYKNGAVITGVTSPATSPRYTIPAIKMYRYGRLNKMSLVELEELAARLRHVNG
jgi:hypothetical protein